METVLELFAGNIQGYGEQLIGCSIAINTNADLLQLRKLDAFKIDYFALWYLFDLDRYSQMKQSIEDNDYLWLLMIGHCSTFNM